MRWHIWHIQYTGCYKKTPVCVWEAVEGTRSGLDIDKSNVSFKIFKTFAQHLGGQQEEEHWVVHHVQVEHYHRKSNLQIPGLAPVDNESGCNKNDFF